MTADSAQWVKLSVQIKSFFWVYLIGAETELRAHFVNLLAVHGKACNRPVKVGVLNSVPKVRALNNRFRTVFRSSNFFVFTVENFNGKLCRLPNYRLQL